MSCFPGRVPSSLEDECHEAQKAIFRVWVLAICYCHFETQWPETHHGSPVFHQVDANNPQKRSKAQLDVERKQSDRHELSYMTNNMECLCMCDGCHSQWCRGNIQLQEHYRCGWLRSDPQPTPPEPDTAAPPSPTGPFSSAAGTDLRTDGSTGVTNTPHCTLNHLNY